MVIVPKIRLKHKETGATINVDRHSYDRNPDSYAAYVRDGGESGETVTVSGSAESEEGSDEEPSPGSVTVEKEQTLLPDISGLTIREVMNDVQEGKISPEIALLSEKAGKNRTSLIDALERAV